MAPGREDPISQETQDYQVDPIYWSEKKKYQLYETRGTSLKREDYKYHTPLYKDLLTAVVPLRTSFRKEKDNSARKEIAKTEFDAWNLYLEMRKQEISQLKDLKSQQEENVEFFEAHNKSQLHYSHDIPSHELAKLREWFDRSKVSLNFD